MQTSLRIESVAHGYLKSLEVPRKNSSPLSRAQTRGLLSSFETVTPIDLLFFFPCLNELWTQKVQPACAGCSLYNYKNRWNVPIGLSQ